MINFVLQSPYSLFVAYLILIGTYRLGGYFLSIKKVNLIFKKISVINFQKLIIGHIISLLVLFPLIAFTNHSSFILKFFASLLVLLSIFEIYDFIKKYHKINFSFLLKDKYLLFNIIILILYLFLTSSPETSADTLDYHIGTALNIIRFDSYVFLAEWFTSIQSGIGEILIALGYSLGAEQYGSLIQFSSLLSITGIIFKICENRNFFNSKYFANLIVISCPVLLFLASGSKPQLFFSSLLFLALSIVFSVEKRNYLSYSYSIVCVLIFLSIAGKFSYNLSGFLIWTFATLKLISFKNFSRLFLITIVSFLIILCPFVYLKWINLGGNFISYFFSPFPLHLPGYDIFLEHIKSPTYVKFPFFLFYNTSLSRISETLAFSSILLIFLIYNLNYRKFKNNDLLFIILIIFFYFFVSNLYASPNARYYFDVVLWSTLGIKFFDKKININFLKYILLIQPLFITVILSFSVLNFFPGSLSQDLYIKMKNKFAFQYSGIEWVNQNLPDNTSVIINARPISIYKDFASSGIFMNFTFEQDSIYYREILKSRKPKYLISFGKEPSFDHLEGCVISLYKKKENVGFHATRNIFGRGDFYNAYIHELDYNKLPECK